MDTKNFNFIDKFIAKLRLDQIIGQVRPGDVVLDFGCGAKSYLLESIKSKIKYGIGIDYDVENRKEGNIEYIHNKFIGKLPFICKNVDAVFLLAVLEHIEADKVNELFSEFKRVLKKNGKIVLTTPTPKGQKILEFMAYRLKIISVEEIKDHKKYYDKNEILKLAKNCNFRIVNYYLFQFGLNSCAVLEKNN